MRRVFRLFMTFAATILLIGAIPISANAAETPNVPVTSDDPDRVIYVDSPAPRIPDDATVMSRSESLEVKTSPVSLLEYPVADGEHLMVVYNDGIVYAARAGACTVTSTAYTPVKNDNKAWISGAFNRSYGCDTTTGRITLYSGIVAYGQNSAVISPNGATVVISATKACNFSYSTTWYGFASWATGGGNSGPTASLPCRPL